MPVSTCRMCSSTWYKDVFVEDGVLVRRCLGCRHVYSSFDQPEHYDAYWDDLGPAEIDPRYWDDAHQRIFAHFIDLHLDPTRHGRIVDVGAGLGYFVAHVLRHRPSWTVSGSELSARAVDYGRSVLGLGDHISVGAVERLELEPGSIDIFTLWDVLEHLPDPVPLLRHLRTRLAPGGFVFIQTPSANFQLARAWCEVLVRDRGIIPGRQYLAPRNHVNLFTRRSLAQMATTAGFAAPTLEVLPPIAAIEGNTGLMARATKVGYYQLTRGLFAASGGRAMLNPTLFARLTAA